MYRYIVAVVAVDNSFSSGYCNQEHIIEHKDSPERRLGHRLLIRKAFLPFSYLLISHSCYSVASQMANKVVWHDHAHWIEMGCQMALWVDPADMFF